MTNHYGILQKTSFHGEIDLSASAIFQFSSAARPDHDGCYSFSAAVLQRQAQ